jgi:hypothetical protein
MHPRNARIVQNWVDTSETIPIRLDVPTPVHDSHGPRPQRRAACVDLSLGSTWEHEVWRTRNLPHMYTEADIEQADVMRNVYVHKLSTRTGVDYIDWDCNHCKRAVLTPASQFTAHTTCPECGMG